MALSKTAPDGANVSPFFVVVGRRPSSTVAPEADVRQLFRELAPVRKRLIAAIPEHSLRL